MPPKTRAPSASKNVIPAGMIRSSLRFPVLVALSLLLATLANTIAAVFTGDELSSVSRTLNKGWQAGLVLSWKVVELGICWYCSFDDIDVLSLTTLTHLPHFYLLHTFYSVSLTSVLLQFVLTLLSTGLPFTLCRRRSGTHTPLLTLTSTSFPFFNTSSPKPIRADPQVLLPTLLLPSAIYTLAVQSSFSTWLPAHLITHFDGLKTLAPTHASLLWFWAATCIPIGTAAREFLLGPALPLDTKLIESDLEVPTLESRFSFILPQLSPMVRTLILRTVVLVGWTAANTWFLAWVGIEGAEGLGALGWAGVWTAAAASTGAVMCWVADV